MVLDQYQSFQRLQHTFGLYKNIAWGHTSEFYSERVNVYMMIKDEEKKFF